MTKEKIWVILAAVLLLFPAVAVAGAQGTTPELLQASWVRISASPSEIPADGVSTSEIKVVVSWPPETERSGEPAENETVDMRTTLGWLTEIGNESNTGGSISLIMDNNGTATALLSGNDTLGDALITVECHNGGGNFTKVTFLEPGATAAPPSGNGGDGRIPPTPPAGTPAYIDLSANPTDIPADGSSTSTLTASVWDGEDWVLDNLTVNFSTSLGKITASAVIENGTATGILTAGTEEGVATITAEANLNGDIGTVTNTTRVNFTTPGVTPTPPVTVTPTPTITVSPTPTATVSPTPSPTSKPLIPGFEAVFAIAGLLTVAYLVKWRRRI